MRPDEPSQSIRTAELLGTFAVAGDLAFGFQLEDSIRTCYLSMRLAKSLGLSEGEQTAVFYTALLKDAGCTCWTSQMSDFLMTDEIAARLELMVYGAATSPDSLSAWAEEHVAARLPQARRQTEIDRVLTNTPAVFQEAFATSCEIAGRIAARFGMPLAIRHSLISIFEQWSGAGAPNGLAGEDIPLPSRIVGLAFFAVPYYRRGGPSAALDMTQAGRGRVFAPEVVEAFHALAAEPGFWEELDGAMVWDDVLRLEPISELYWTDAAGVDALAFALADFIDLKAPAIAAHSRRVARIAEELAALLGCDETERTRIRWAGLTHDLGLVGVPSYLLNKPLASLAFAEQEQLRLHPYHGERILSLIPSTQTLAPLVGGHDERIDGGGAYRGLRGRDIPLGARIIAVANRLDELTHEAPGQTPTELSAALDQLGAEAGSSLDAEIVAAIRGALGATKAAKPQGEWPAGLTGREVEVLRLASKGLTRRQIGESLAITENTVRHHLEHIYNKTGTTSRVGATLFAMENDLLP
jgi:HD-GYP domain-containing protein (c-di-GMP phosphodiesterase class II)